MRRVFFYVILLLFNSCGVLLISAAIQRYATADASEHWPTVEGKVLSIQVIEQESDARFRKRGEPVTYTYHAEVQYEYAVDGEAYQGQRVTVNDYGTNDRERAEQIAMQFQQGGPVTVYYDPAAPKSALLKPGNTDGVVVLVIMGIVFMVVPSGLVFAVGGRELVPLVIRVWWSMHFGKLRNVEVDPQDVAAQTFPSRTEPVTFEEPSPYPHPVKNFREEIVSWYPGRRVELIEKPPSIWFLLLGSAVLGGFAALFGGTILGLLIFGDRAPTAYYGGIAAVLFVVTFAGVFVTSRLQSRGSHTVIDWDANLLDTHREFSMPWQGSLHDLDGLTARLTRDKGRKPQFRTVIEVDAVGKQFMIAQTRQARRKPDVIRAEASSLAEPLAATLKVPLHMEGWDGIT